MTDAELKLEFTPTGKTGTGTLTARVGGSVVAVDTLNIHRAAAREKLVAQLIEKLPGLDAEEVGAELLRIAGDTAKRPSEPAPQQGDADEITGAIVRPELFHTEHVSGVCVPDRRIANGRPCGEWTLYLRWHRDGRRERRALEASIELADKTRLLFFPTPGEPMPTQAPGWSRDHRATWLKGEPTGDPTGAFKRICELIAHYLEFPETVAAATTATLACWVLLTYAYPAWPGVPYLSVGGPLASGKTTLFRVLAWLCFRPLESSNMTAPCLFRTLHDVGGTLLLDEAERLRDSAPDAGELRSILLSGYKSGSPAIRLEKTDTGFRRTPFDVYGPKALAAIARLPEALASRCIRIGMIRAEPGSPKPRRRLASRAAVFAQVRDDLHSLALEHGPVWLQLAELADVCPATFGGRDYELWQPLLALASWLDEAGASGVLDIVRDFAEASLDADREDSVPDCDELLLSILAEHVRGGTVATLKAGGILDVARERDPLTFGTPERPKWSAKGVGAALGRYGLKTKKGPGSTGRTYKGVSEADLRHLQRVYGFDLGFCSDDVPIRTACAEIRA